MDSILPTISITFPPDYVKPPLPGGRELFDALKSGKYQKGRGQLCYEGEYCCLGVKCELDGLLKENRYVLETLIGNGDEKNTSCLPYRHPWGNLYGSILDFPKNVEVKINLANRKEIAIDIVTINDFVHDNISTTFDQIADTLEQIFDLDAAEIVNS